MIYDTSLSELKRLEHGLKTHMRSYPGITLSQGKEYFTGDEELITAAFDEYIQQVAQEVHIEHLPLQKPMCKLYCLDTGEFVDG